MNSKITFPELVDIVAAKAGTTKRMSELFLKELFATITQALDQGESVKVKGLGTFKLTAVSERKSVDVNTGEEISIPGHNKLTFVPDKALAEAINQPFAHFETIVLDDSVTDDQLAALDTDATGQQAEEPQPELPPVFEPEPEPDLEPEPQPEPDFEPEPEPEEEPEPAPAVADEPHEDLPEPASDQPGAPSPMAAALAAPVTEADAAAEGSDAPAGQQQAVEQGGGDAELEAALDALRVGHEREKRRLAHRMLAEGFLVGVVTTLIVAWVSYRLYMMKYGPVQPGKAATEQVQEAVPAPADTVKKDAAPAPVAKPAVTQAKRDTAAAKPAAAPAKPAAAAPAPKPAPAVTEVVKPGSTLMRMANKHYGNKYFWIYIYEENRAAIKNPDNMVAGTKVVIPPAAKYGIDKNDAASVDRAKQKIRQYYNKKK